jgi:type II secretory ATPase GspE/PulE/Tfp pilus assembly ATPase PilB-like protein
MRLIDMGVEPYLVSSTLVGAMAQRLVRKICSKCKAEAQPEHERVPADFNAQPDDVLYRGQGCDHCRRTGFRGRSGLYELLLVDEVISGKIMDRAPLPEIVAAGRRSGLKLLREDGWDKVRRGITTIDEVLTCTAI